MDAADILEKSVGIREVPFPGAGRIWSFLPENRAYPLLNSDQNGQDFVGVLLGDVTGNWTPPAGGLLGVDCEEDPPPALLSLPSVTASLGRGVNLGLELALSNAVMHAANIRVAYDPALLSLGEVVPGPAAESMMLAVNQLPAGEIRIGLAGSQAVSSGGTLLTINFAVVGVSHAPIPVVVQDIEIDEGAVCATSEDGSVTLVFATADLDKDGDIDGVDLQRCASCSLGPNVSRDGSPSCQVLDFDHDGDVDQSDFGILQRCYSGAGKPADPNCMN
jgi:hypothetical protein